MSEELALRIPYKMFKENHPDTDMSYDDYKKLQKKKAFKNMVPPEENKRMVR